MIKMMMDNRKQTGYAVVSDQIIVPNITLRNPPNNLTLNIQEPLSPESSFLY